MKREKKITLSVDCMGGDNSIEDIIGGVRQFCYENNNDNFLLHGNKSLIELELDKYPEIKTTVKLSTVTKLFRWKTSLLNPLEEGKTQVCGTR